MQAGLYCNSGTSVNQGLSVTLLFHTQSYACKCRVDNQEQASSSRGSASQPIDMSMRAEHNKVRTHLAGSKKDRSSPYGTPIAKSPLSSPLIADAAALEALNLNPGSAKSVMLMLMHHLRHCLAQTCIDVYCQLLPVLLLLAACVRCMLVAHLHIFISCTGVQLHWQAFDVRCHGRLTRSAFGVTCIMLCLW